MSTERRSLPRTSVESLTYVSIGEENGGILLDINKTGFSMQTAVPLDGANSQRQARFSGNGDFEIANGIPPLSLSCAPATADRIQRAATLAKLDEVRSMLLNSRLTIKR